MTWQTVGFDKNKKLFEEAFKGGELGHAYIFSGPDMIGKRTFALELADLVQGSVTGTSPVTHTNVRYGANPDLLIVDQVSSESGQSITIDEIRKIKNFVSFKPYAGIYKFVIIDDAHLMTVEAQNALLKTLEEPNSSSIFILITANPELLLGTVNSRCQQINFLPHPKKTITNVLERSDLSVKNAEFLAEFSNGRIGLASDIIENKSFNTVKESVQELTDLMKTDINNRLVVAQKLSDIKNEHDLQKKVLYWLLYARMRLDEPKAPKILKNLLVLHDIIGQPQFNKRLALENFLIKL